MTPEETAPRRRVPVAGLALLGAMVLVLIAGVVLLAAKPKATPHASGLRGNLLPAGLAGRAAPRIVGRDQAGRPFDTTSLRGKAYAVTFLYTECPDVCPLIGEELQEALKELGPRARRAAVVAVSVDPHGDTPDAVARWLRTHHEPSNFHYLIGTRAALTPTWKAYFISPEVADRPSAASTHTATVWLVDGRGRLRTNSSAGGLIAPADLVHDFTALQDE